MPAARRLLRRYRPIQSRARDKNDQDAGWSIWSGGRFDIIVDLAQMIPGMPGSGLVAAYRRAPAPARLPECAAQMGSPDCRSARWSNRQTEICLPRDWTSLRPGLGFKPTADGMPIAE